MFEDIDINNPRKNIEEAIEDNRLADLLKMAGITVGHYCTALAMGVKAGVKAWKDLDAKSSLRQDLIFIVETNICFADGAKFIFGSTLGGMIYRDYGKMAFTLAKRSGEAIRISAKQNLAGDLSPELARLTQKVVFERSATEEEKKEMHKMLIDESFNLLDAPDEKMFNINRFEMEVPDLPEFFNDDTCCSVCGEYVMENKLRIMKGKPVCIPCSGQQYYQSKREGISVGPGI